jgi:hypothetical protein
MQRNQPDRSQAEQIAYLEGQLETAYAEISKMRQATPITNEPLLGLATTEDLMRELISRFKMVQYDPDTNMLGLHVAVERALVLAEMLGGLSASEREYRTVDHD